MSTSERIEVVAGVCPLIIHPINTNLYLGIQEKTWKRETNKLAGMWSPAFETVEPGESHLEALKRCIGGKSGQPLGEEIGLKRGVLTLAKDVDTALLCKVQLSPGVWLYVYPVVASKDLVVGRGSKGNEVESPAWMSADLILESLFKPKQFSFRPGVLEIVKSFKDWRSNIFTYQPRIFESPVNSVPYRVFDLLESGISQSEALSRLGLGPQRLLVPDSSGHFLLLH